jgi:hypothetical protein
VLLRVKSLAEALIRPDRAFRQGGLASIRPLSIAIVLFLLYAIGQRLISGYDQNPDIQLLAIGEVETRIGSLMTAAPADVQNQTRSRMVQALLGGGSTVLASFSIVASALGFLILAMEVWLVLSVLAQFAGGEEERGADGRHRKSMLFVLVAFIPLALRKLAEGLVMAFKDPAVAANSLTLSDYRELSKVHFDLYGLLRLPHLPAFPGYLVRSATDPFSLWFLCILVVGGTRIYRMPFAKTLLQALLLLVVLAAQSTLFATIGLSWEI